MKNEKFKTEQLKEVTGGLGPDIQPTNTDHCRQCGRKEDAMFLYAHGGLCRMCCDRKPIPTYPDCGGILMPAPDMMHEVGNATWMCVDCGKTLKINN